MSSWCPRPGHIHSSRSTRWGEICGELALPAGIWAGPWRTGTCRDEGYGRQWLKGIMGMEDCEPTICSTGSTGPIKRHISLVSYAFYDHVLCPSPMRGTWVQKVSQAGWSFRLEHLPSHQSCCLYKHFIRNFHQFTCSLRLYRHMKQCCQEDVKTLKCWCQNKLLWALLLSERSLAS